MRRRAGGQRQQARSKSGSGQTSRVQHAQGPGRHSPAASRPAPRTTGGAGRAATMAVAAEGWGVAAQAQIEDPQQPDDGDEADRGGPREGEGLLLLEKLRDVEVMCQETRVRIARSSERRFFWIFFTRQKMALPFLTKRTAVPTPEEEEY